jgi:hypothetical protein
MNAATTHYGYILLTSTQPPENSYIENDVRFFIESLPPVGTKMVTYFRKYKTRYFDDNVIIGYNSPIAVADVTAIS